MANGKTKTEVQVRRVGVPQKTFDALAEAKKRADVKLRKLTQGSADALLRHAGGLGGTALAGAAGWADRNNKMPDVGVDLVMVSGPVMTFLVPMVLQKLKLTKLAAGVAEAGLPLMGAGAYKFGAGHPILTK